MAALSDNIEQFIKDMMKEYEGILELQRNELADYFRCAPSQINYVLATRFSPEKGYIIESRRGSGGFIKLIRVNESRADRIRSILAEKIIDGRLNQRDAFSIADCLLSSGVIGEEQHDLINAAVSDRAVRIPASIRDSVRADIMKQMMIALLKNE